VLQLEADPELAGLAPAPSRCRARAILSELLQNADDAGASEARVSIENDRFVFEHNGEDFIEAHFASICRFGYSNKRALHTIGFRGSDSRARSAWAIGSSCSRRPWRSPSNARGSPEPHWIDAVPDIGNHARRGGDRQPAAAPGGREESRRVAEEPGVAAVLQEIRRLRIGDSEVHWQSLGPGPIAESEWMALDEKADDPFLLVRSGEEAFPAEALDEIRKERMLGAEDSGDFPPCRVEIVLGAKGRLYVVLPTGVETALPFACNAPFIQDPARLKIKDPETSPTNRWLLNRAGGLAASAMMEWLEQTNRRAGSGGRLRSAAGRRPRGDDARGGVWRDRRAGVRRGDRRPIDASDRGGALVDAKAAITVPRPIFDIWPAEQAMALLDAKSRPALCQHVSAKNRTKLVQLGSGRGVLEVGSARAPAQHHLPRPATWRHL
jgi:hypothetical protein